LSISLIYCLTIEVVKVHDWCAENL